MITSVLFYMFTLFSAGLMVLMTHPAQAEGLPSIHTNVPVATISHTDEPTCTDSDGDEECDENDKTRD